MTTKLFTCFFLINSTWFNELIVVQTLYKYKCCFHLQLTFISFCKFSKIYFFFSDIKIVMHCISQLLHIVPYMKFTLTDFILNWKWNTGFSTSVYGYRKFKSKYYSTYFLYMWKEMIMKINVCIVLGKTFSYE